MNEADNACGAHATAALESDRQTGDIADPGDSVRLVDPTGLQIGHTETER